MVLGTHGFWAVVSERLMTTAVGKMESGFEDAVEMVASEVQASEGESGGAGALLRFQGLKFKVQNLEEKETLEQEVRVMSKNGIMDRWTNLAKKVAGKVYLRQGDRQEQRKRMIKMGLAFMVIVMVLFGAGQAWNRRKTQTGSMQTARIEKIQSDFEEARAIVELNPTRSRELLTQVKQAINEAGDKNEKLKTITEQWQQVWNEAAGIKAIKHEEVLDLRLVRDGMTGQRMAKLEEEILVLDNLSGKVAEINAKSGAGKIIAGGEELVGAKGITAYPGRYLVWGDKGVWDVSDGKVQGAVDADDILKVTLDVRMWAGNIYAMGIKDGKLMIWRFQAAGDGFGIGKEWLAGEETIDVGGDATMAIDGSIWIASGANLIKFTQGVRDDFGLSGMDGELAGTVVVYTDEENESLYLLEKGKARVVVTDKQGNYQKQYQGEVLGKAADMLVDAAAGVGYILADGKVWRFGL